VRLVLDDGSQRQVDHVVLATGYRVDLSRYAFLAPQERRAIACSGGYPQLKPNFESSLPGLFFVGAPAANSFGPLLRFVAGTAFCARTVSQAITTDIIGVKRLSNRLPTAETVDGERQPIWEGRSG
jgi:hypothetical protein